MSKKIDNYVEQVAYTNGQDWTRPSSQLQTPRSLDDFIKKPTTVCPGSYGDPFYIVSYYTVCPGSSDPPEKVF